MNSFSGNNPNRVPASATAVSFDSYQFDFGLTGSSSSRPLRDHKPNPTAGGGVSGSSAGGTWAYQPAKPSWTHQPKSGGILNPPSSMVGDIFGKSWTASTAGLGIPETNPSLFGDLVGSALGRGGTQNNSGSVPLKAAPPRNAYSMGNLADSLPKPAAGAGPMKPSLGSVDNLGKFSALGQGRGGIGQPMKSAPGAPPMNAKKDPFGSLMDFGSKNSANPPMASANSANASGSSAGDYSFGAFQNAGATKTANSSNSGGSGADFSFGAFQNANSKTMDDFGMPVQSFSPPPPQPAPVKGGSDPLDMLFTSSASSAPAAATASPAEVNDWDVGAAFGGYDGGDTTTELEGLPPPPSGVTAPVAKSKGLDNYKGGQYADAIKWLSWAVVLLEKSGDSASMLDVLVCRASCYKEVGEYKKAVADCTKVLDQDSENVGVLIQRALLYESTEKYKLGAEDLRMVLKIDPGNRIARSTIHRLTKLAD